MCVFRSTAAALISTAVPTTIELWKLPSPSGSPDVLTFAPEKSPAARVTVSVSFGITGK